MWKTFFPIALVVINTLFISVESMKNVSIFIYLKVIYSLFCSIGIADLIHSNTLNLRLEMVLKKKSKCAWNLYNVYVCIFILHS